MSFPPSDSNEKVPEADMPNILFHNYYDFIFNFATII